MPEKLPNTDGRYTLFSRALQMTDHDRWGVNISNRMELSDVWALTLSGDFSKEKLKQTDNASDDIGSTYIFASNYLGPRGGLACPQQVRGGLARPWPGWHGFRPGVQ